MRTSYRKVLALLIAMVIAMSFMTGCKKEAEPEAWQEAQESSEVSETKKTMTVQESSEVVEESSEPEESEESSEEVAEPETEDTGFRNPLTGEMTEKDYSTKRPYVFMCNDIPVSMPQCGVSQADMIMEMMDESGVTRFMVWFMDPTDVEKIGSVRSARQYNVETAYGYDAFLGHCGGSTEAMNNIQNYGVLDIDQFWLGDEAYYRDPSRQEHGIEHSMFAVGADCVTGALEHFGYDADHPEGYDGTYGMIFTENAVDQCTEKAENIHVAYAGWKTTDFIYDVENNGYIMYQFDEEYSDDGEGGIYFTNVINMYATTWIQSDGVHLTIQLDEGEGTFFTGGKAVAIKWYKDGLEDCFHFTLEDGTPLEFSVGKTFICVNQCGDYSYQGTCEYN